MMNRKYNYYDEWDAIVARFIEKHSPWRDYWAHSEEAALRFAYEAARQVRGGRLLDLGCGRGRLLPKFATFFDEIVALDADKIRLLKAENFVNEERSRHPECFSQVQVRFENEFFEDYRASDDRPFSMALCSHVLQHLPTAVVQPLIDHVTACLVPGGYLVLLTSHSMRQHDAYKLWRLTDSDDGLHEEDLEKSAFDTIMADGSRMDRIPTHAFALNTLRMLLARYQTRDMYCFHALHGRNPLDAVPSFASAGRHRASEQSSQPGIENDCYRPARERPFRDKWINWPMLKGRFGMDVLVVARK